jgi:hypothetical protein
MPLLTNEDLKIINKMKGQIIGSSLKADRKFILEKLGEESLRKVEKEMVDLGYSLKYEEIEKYQWYPVQMDALFLILSKEIFNWGEKEMWEWGRWAAKTHFLTKMMIKYFVSKELLAKNANKSWRKYYTRGELIFTFKEKEGKVELKDFVIHPDHLSYLTGYLYQIASLVMPPENLKLEPIKTSDLDHHFFQLSW